jgi:hypothetical protein
VPTFWGLWWCDFKQILRRKAFDDKYLYSEVVLAVQKINKWTVETLDRTSQNRKPEKEKKAAHAGSLFI